jgi:hypothetical protein
MSDPLVYYHWFIVYLFLYFKDIKMSRKVPPKGVLKNKKIERPGLTED